MYLSALYNYSLKYLKKYNYIDLFSGVGGISLGLKMAGFENVFSNEYDKEIALSYSKNFPEHKMINEDINALDFEGLKSSFGLNDHSVDLIVGGPPCQGFSMANRKRIDEDPRNLLFTKFHKAVRIIKPKCFLIENVMGMSSETVNLSSKEFVLSENLAEYFKQIGYSIKFTSFKSEEHGVPQIRRRIMIVGTRLENKRLALDQNKIGNLQKKFLSKDKLIKKDDGQIELFANIEHNTLKKPVTVWQAISDLPSLEKKLECSEYLSNPSNDYQRYLRKDSDGLFNHKKTPHSQEAIERIMLIKQGENFTSLPENLKTKSVHSGAYGRLEAAGLSPTITTRFDTPSTGRVIHPFEHRCLTVREAARIQSFPDSFVFHGSRTSQGKQVGNAVPPLVAKEIGEMFKKDFLDGPRGI